MRKRLLVILALVVVLGMAALLVLRRHAVEIVHAVVENAIIQKAPAEYPPETIRGAFTASLRAAQKNGTTRQYLERLEQISQRIEKVQRLDKSDVDELLDDLKR